MESEGRELDEAKLESAIADLLSDEPDDKPEPLVSADDAARKEQVFPELPEQEDIEVDVSPQSSGLAATLIQKWAEIRGAA